MGKIANGLPKAIHTPDQLLIFQNADNGEHLQNGDDEIKECPQTHHLVSELIAVGEIRVQ